MVEQTRILVGNCIRAIAPGQDGMFEPLGTELGRVEQVIGISRRISIASNAYRPGASGAIIRFDRIGCRQRHKEHLVCLVSARTGSTSSQYSTGRVSKIRR